MTKVLVTFFLKRFGLGRRPFGEFSDQLCQCVEFSVGRVISVFVLSCRIWDIRFQADGAERLACSMGRAHAGQLLPEVVNQKHSD